MDYALIWFCLIGLLWAGYLVLEGFDFGVGALLPVLGTGKIDMVGVAKLVKARAAGAPAEQVA